MTSSSKQRFICVGVQVSLCGIPVITVECDAQFEA